MRIHLRSRILAYIIGFSIFTLAIALFWRPAFAQLSKFILQEYCTHCLQSVLTAEQVKFKDGQVVFSKVKIRNISEDSPWIVMESKKIRLGWSIFPFDSQISVALELDSPVISIAEHEGGLSTLLASFKEGADDLIRTTTQVTINNGLLTLKDPSEKKQTSYQLEGYGNQFEGFFSFISQEQGQFSCHYEGNDWNFICDELNVADANLILKTLGIGSLPFRFYQGKLRGDLNVEWDEEDFPEIYGAFQLVDCVFDTKSGDMHGFIPEAVLMLSDAGLAGEFSLGNGTYFEYAKEGKFPVSISQLEARLSLPAYDRCYIHAKGLCSHHGETFDLAINGHIKVPAHEKASCDVEVTLLNHEKEPIRACLSSHREGFGLSQCMLDIQNIGAGEWDLLMLALGTQDIGLDPYTLLNGLIDARIQLDLENFKVKKIKIEEFAAKGISFELDQSDTLVKIDQAHGNLFLDLSVPNVLDSLQATFGIKGGMIHFPALNQQQWQLTNLETDLTIENGTFKKSFVEADFMGLSGLIEVDWASERVMSMQFKGGISELADLTSRHVKKGILKKFKNDQLLISWDVFRKQSGLNVDGKIEISTQKDQEKEVIYLGFTLDRTKEQKRDLPDMNFASRRLGAEVIDAIAGRNEKNDQKEQPSLWLKKELYIAGFCLNNGWFTAAQLPTEKYIEPFFFDNGQMHLNGTADFEGRFDCDRVAVEYVSNDLVLENDELSFDLGTVGLRSPASHYFDLINDVDFGEVPVSNGTYFEKNSGLLFTQVEGLMRLKNKTIHIPDLETYCNHVFFAGAMDIDYSSPEKGVFDVSIHTNKMEGTFSHVRDLLAHFNKTAGFTEVPLEGDVFLDEQGADCFFAFKPSECHIKGTAKGYLKNGRLETPLKNIHMDKINLTFHYDHNANSLSIGEIDGRLNLDSTSETSFQLSKGVVDFIDLDQFLVSFDLPIYEQTKEAFRMAGHTRILDDDEDRGLLSVDIDHALTHYAGVHPSKFEAFLNPEMDIEKLALEWNCSLDTWFPHLQQIGNVFLTEYAPSLAKQWSKISAPKGNFSAGLCYDRYNSQWKYHLTGENIEFGNNQFKNVILSGSKKRHLWSIEQLQIDKISIATDILPEKNGCHLNFLGFRYSDVLLIGLEGFFDFEQASLHSRIDLLEVDFSKIGQLKSFKELVDDYHPKGNLKGSGTMNLTLQEEWPPKLELQLNTSLRNCMLRNLTFDNADHVACNFSLGNYLQLKEWKTGVLCHESGLKQGQVDVDEAYYDFKKEELSLEGMHFHTPASHLAWIADQLESTFPEAVNAGISKIIKNIKTTDAFKGSMDVRISDDSTNVSLRLPQGTYRLGSKDHEVNNFKLEWDRRVLKIISQYRFQNTLYWITVNSTSPEVDAGDINVSAYPPEELKFHPNECLCLSWYIHPSYGMVVEKAFGRLPGVVVDLTRDRSYPMNPHSWHLDGQIILDPKAGEHILPPDIVQAISSWKISRSYHLNGKWIFMLDSEHEGELCFQGQLSGNNVILKGYEINHISADLHCNPLQIDIQNLLVQDAAGHLSTQAASMIKQDSGDWWVYIPHLEGNRFRPSLLREAEGGAGLQKPLVVDFFIDNIVCRADDLATMTGTGKLVFSNSSKRPLHNPILAIPAEIISRIGLNLDVLNPVIGTILFNIQDFKVYLTKFKDVYSEGKLSKFYLPDNNYLSYVDLDGNIHVQVRMKQYNLLFKLAELFTVTIHGSLPKPIYTLQKQN